MAQPVVISLELASHRSESQPGWDTETFVLAGVARGSVGETRRLELQPDDVIELELDSGECLLVAAEDAGRYLGGGQGRGGDADPVLVVGGRLRPTGPQLPATGSRDGLGSWVLRALKVHRQGPAGVTALAAAGAFQDYQLGNRRGLQRLSTESWSLAAVERMEASPEPSLLFLHGTASSTEGSFRALWGGNTSEVDLRARLGALYGARVYGFEHRSLTDSPVANALELAKALPDGARLHLVSHSRGGMIGELLVRGQRRGGEPFSAGDIQRFVDHGRRTGRQGYEKDAADLAELGRLLAAKRLQAERFVRVGATARGTTLASGRLDRWASVMLNLLGRGIGAIPGLQGVATGYGLLQSFLRSVVKMRSDARILPGLEAMMPDSPLVALLNAPDVEVESPLHVIAGDYEGKGLLAWLGDCLSEAFYGGATDLVVNTPSMSGGAPRTPGIWVQALSGPDVNHLSYFNREESAGALIEALEGRNSRFARQDGPSRTDIARGGRKPMPRPDAPIALMLPGVMGSHLAIGSDRIWFDPFSMVAGEMSRLGVDAQGVEPDGWQDISYEAFARHLSFTHEVRPFAYDWRLSLSKAADRFGVELDKAMETARQRGKPVHIVAHSMGGLVARLAMKDRWAALKAIPGSRLIQFGTPNNGSHSIAAVLTGRDAFVQKIERYFDWRHDMREFLEIVSLFPGVLELLPWPVKDGKAGDGIDYFDPQVWQDWAARDAENQRSRDADMRFERAKGAGDGWPVPTAEALAQARQTILAIQGVELDPACCLYVAGRERTPVALRVSEAGQVEIGWTDSGDGRVAWATGIPPKVPVWYVDAAHGDLLNHEDAFEEYVSIIQAGASSLPTSPVSSRGREEVSFAPAPLEVHTLYPTAEEVLASALCSRPGKSRKAGSEGRKAVQIQLTHGSLACAVAPLIIGAYDNDPVKGSASFLDRLLGGSLGRAQRLGRYPGRVGEAMVFLAPSPATQPAGAVVVGLGPVGSLQPGVLTRALTQGLLEYARVWSTTHPPGKTGEMAGLDLSALLVGTGYGGVPVAVGVRCLAEALVRAGEALRQAQVPVCFQSLQLFEEEESRAISAGLALRELAGDGKFLGAIRFDGQIRSGQGSYRGRLEEQSVDGWQRVHVVEVPQGGLRFTLVTERARNEVNDEPDQRQAVDGLIRTATGDTSDQPGLSRALFELLVPNGFKEALPDLRGLILGVDPVAAVYPWELMRDEADRFETPLVTRIGLVRQLASTHGRPRVPTVRDLSALVVGDTDSGFAALPGAQREGMAVATALRNNGYRVNYLERPDGQTVMVNLFDEHYRVIHLAAHGNVSETGGQTGMVLGPDTYLTTAQISKLRWVPELVFINCCHLGNMQADARPRWGELAANLATEFIEMGCRAVIAAGWAVDDAAAEVFSATFYREMLAGRRFGDAVRQARLDAYRRHPATNTWGAYQAYGDERYRLIGAADDDWKVPDYIHPGQAAGELERLFARAASASEEERGIYRGRLEQIEAQAVARFPRSAEVSGWLGKVWAALGDKGKAIAGYRAALGAEGSVSLDLLEQLGNLEVRHGEALCAGARAAGVAEPDAKARQAEGEALMAMGCERLEGVLALGRTVERECLVASSVKRRAVALRLSGKALDAELQRVRTLYAGASELSVARDGDRDYYSTLNALDLEVLLAARGQLEVSEVWRDSSLARCRESVANGARRFRLEPGYFHALAEADAARVEAMIAVLTDRPDAGLTSTKVLEDVAQRYRSLFVRLGSAQEHDSTLNQLAWLVRLLPAKGKGHELAAALKALQKAIKLG